MISKFIAEYLLQVYTHTHTHSFCLCLLLPQAGFIHVRDKIVGDGSSLIYLRQREWFFGILCFGFWLWFYVKPVQIFTTTLIVHYGAQALWQVQGWCGRWRHSQLGDSHKKTRKESERGGRYTGRMSIFLTWALFLHHKAMSFPNKT